MSKLLGMCGCLFALAGPVFLPATVAADPITLASKIIVVTTAFPSRPGDSSGILTITSGDYQLFEHTPISATDIGQTLVADSADPDFAGVVSRLTNGQPNSIAYDFSGGGEFFGSEAAFFNLPPGMIDFAGSTISALTFTVNDFSSMAWAGHPGYTQLHLNGDLDVQGVAEPPVTPEPASLLLFAAGAAPLALRRRRRRPVPRAAAV